MKRMNRGTLAMLVSLAVVPTGWVQAQSPAPAPSEAPAAKTFSQQELDQLLAPIALYPDALLAQIFMASTYPLDVVNAARWVKANPKVTGKALEDAMATQPWDPAVKSLAAVPQVLQQMDEKIDWTQKLGDAFLAQQQDVMNTVQSLRAKADASGNLKSTEQMVVKKEVQASQTIYVVESPQTEVVYVPAYNPTVVYGTWPYAAPPYYMYPPGYAYAPGLTFLAGAAVGAALWGNCNWGHGDIDIDVNKSNNFNRTNNSSKTWNHNAQNRGGVAYRDQGTANKYGGNRGGGNAQSREQFRGRENAGGDRGGAGGRGDVGGRGDAGGRGDFGGGGGAQSRDRGGNSGFSGAGNGASTRDASARGGASRSSMSSHGGGSRASAGGGGSRGGGGARGGGGGGRGGGGRR